ncbi:hypothetical protein GF380_01040, partial [Candidatus Uhrbacteria bacterium]|nr:hypothetical protein [Candidatus Uhrbacteria bacterium]MBD3283906.1 hypothetical protein [Candidatus Uhrbacteria bacterium]
MKERLPLSPIGERQPKQKKSSSRLTRALQHPLTKAGVAATALHLPFTPVGQKIYEAGKDLIVSTRASESGANVWERSDVVLEPQTAKDRHVVIEAVQD